MAQCRICKRSRGDIELHDHNGGKVATCRECVPVLTRREDEQRKYDAWCARRHHYLTHVRRPVRVRA